MKFSLNYYGGMADEHLLDFYDASRAMMGFERTLALTAHLVINDEIITQVTSLKGARVLLAPMEAGSLRIPAYVVAGATAIYSLGSLEQDNPIGHLMYSAYDAMVHAALGTGLNYDKPLREHIQAPQAPIKQFLPNDPKIQALVEKCEAPLAEMHRPITKSETARSAEIVEGRGVRMPRPIGPPLTSETYDILRYAERDLKPSMIFGKVASYNLNSFKGRMFCMHEQRLISFVLSEQCRGPNEVKRIVESLGANAADINSDASIIKFHVIAERRRTGSVRSYRVMQLSE